MLFQRFEAEGLAHYSYALGCPGAGEIAIVDPKRDIDTYIDFARDQNLRITHILETHIHADYASGARELAARTGATFWASAYDHGEDFEIAFDHRDLCEGDSIHLGGVRIEALHTPGHTPEHLSFLAYDNNRSPHVPMLMLSGDFLFVGSLGRPDLLGDDLKRKLAMQLYRSIHEKIAPLPDGLEIHPAHGSGSLCGAGMSSRAVSTLGYERATNRYFSQSLGLEEFVEEILASVPPLPPYYRRMKEINSSGPMILCDIPGNTSMDLDAAQSHIRAGYPVIDLRDTHSFSAGHIPGALGIGAGDNIATWAPWVVPYDRPILLILPDGQAIDPILRSLIRVGLDDIQGYLQGGMPTWVDADLPVRAWRTFSPETLNHSLKNGTDINIVDVRNDEEWHVGHIDDSIHLTAGQLLQNPDDLPAMTEPLAVICSSGYRSTLAGSVLERLGFANLINITGGIEAWKRAGLPLTQSKEN